MNMNEFNFSAEEIGLMVRKFMSAMGLKIDIEDTNYSNYKYFSHQNYGSIRNLSYVVRVIDDEDQVVYFVYVYWGVIRGELKVYDTEGPVKSSPFAPLGLDNDVINRYLAERTRGMAERWIKTFPEN